MSASREKKLRRELREAELNGDTVKKAKKQKKPMTPMRKKKIHSIISTTLGILVVVLFALLIFVNSGVLQKNSTAVTVGGHKLSPVEFNYFYQDTYNNLKSSYTSYGMWDYMVDTSKPIENQKCSMSEDGGTWKEYITQTAMTSAQQVYSLYDAALDAGYTLTEDAQASLDSMPENVASYAESNHFKNADDYLEDVYGKGADLESYMAYMTAQQYASGYSTEKTDSFTYSDDELRTYYNEKKNDFDTVSYRLFNVATENDDSAAAKEIADDMNAELDGTEKSFIDAAYEYAPEDSKESYEEDDYTLRSNSSYSSLDSDYAEWLFADGRTAGESEVFATSSGYAVVMYLSRENNEYNMVDVRHILVQVEKTGEADSNGNATATDEDWDACREKMDEIVKEWEDSDQTEDTFASMATEKSEDTGSASNGGLLEDVYKGQMVPEFNDWCFEKHEIGDYEVVETDYGCHLIYFSATGDERWKTLADNAKRSEDYQAWYEDYSASYAGKTNFFGQWFTNKELAA